MRKTDNSIQINKKAWEYRAYEFWNNQYTPQALADRIKENPSARLRYHSKYFEHTEGQKIANPCGSNGRIAVPLALLGAEVTVFDISEENRKYSLELAECAGVNIEYVVCDFYKAADMGYHECFDTAYLEGGILHYFHDLDKFTAVLYHIIKQGGRLILSDFHPFGKVISSSSGALGKAEVTGGDYFDSSVHTGDVAYKSFFPENEQPDFPDCSLRCYMIGEIINSIIDAGFILKEFNEHPNWTNNKLPGEFTIVAIK
ncbi:MAG: class I SAM-dependent methyltransferase [Eubacteriales bacterium]